MSNNKFYLRNAGTVAATVAIAGSLALAPALTGFAVSQPSVNSAAEAPQTEGITVRLSKDKVKTSDKPISIIVTGELEEDQNVDFYDGDKKIGTNQAFTDESGETSAAYFWDFKKLTPGQHTVKAVAGDKTATVTLTVEDDSASSPSQPAENPQPAAENPPAPKPAAAPLRLSVKPDKIPARENTQYSEVIATLDGGDLKSGDKIDFSFDNGVKTQTIYASTGYDGVSINAEWFYHFPGKLTPGVHKITATVNGKTLEATFTIEAPAQEAPAAPAPTPQPPATKTETPTKSEAPAKAEETDPQTAQDSEPDTSAGDSQDQGDSETEAPELQITLSKLVAKKGETITITAEGGTVGTDAVLYIDDKWSGSAPVKLVDGKPKAVFQYKVPADLKDGQHPVHVTADDAEGYMSLDTRGSVEPAQNPKPETQPEPAKPDTTQPVQEAPKTAPATSELKLTTPKNTVNISEDVRYEASGMGFDDYNVFYVDGVAITDPEQPIKQGENIINPFTYAFPRGTAAGEHIIGVTSSAKKNHEKGDAGVRYAEVKVNVTAPDASAQPASPYKLEISKDTAKQGETVHIKGSNLPGGSHIHLQVNGKFCFHGDLGDDQTVAECDYKVAPDAKLGDYKVTLEAEGKSAQGIFTVVAADKPNVDADAAAKAKAEAEKKAQEEAAAKAKAEAEKKAQEEAAAKAKADAKAKLQAKLSELQATIEKETHDGPFSQAALKDDVASLASIKAQLESEIDKDPSVEPALEKFLSKFASLFRVDVVRAHQKDIFDATPGATDDEIHAQHDALNATRGDFANDFDKADYNDEALVASLEEKHKAVARGFSFKPATKQNANASLESKAQEIKDAIAKLNIATGDNAKAEVQNILEKAKADIAAAKPNTDANVGKIADAAKAEMQNKLAEAEKKAQEEAAAKAKAEAEAKAKAEADAKAKAEAEAARLKAEAEKKAQEEAAAKAKADAEAKAKADAEAKAKAEAEAKAKAEADRLKAEAEKKAQEEAAAKAKAEAEAKAKAEAARLRAEAEKKAQEEAAAKAKAEADAKAKAEAEAKAKAEAEAKAKADAEAKAKAEAEAKAKAEAEAARLKAEAEKKAQEEAAAKAKAEADAKAKADAEAKAKAKAEAEAKAKAEAEAKAKADAEAARLKAEAEKKAQEEAAAKAKAEADAKAKADAEAKAKAKAEADAKAKADAARLKAEAEKKAQEEAAAKAKAEADTKAKAEAEAKAKAEAEAARLKAEAEKKAQEEAAAKAKAEAEAKAKTEIKTEPVAPAPAPAPTPAPTPAPAPATPAPAEIIETNKAEFHETETVSFRLGRFVPGSTVKIVLHSTPIEIAQLVADKEGIVSGSFKWPAGLELGTHELIGIGHDGTVHKAILQLAQSAPAPQTPAIVQNEKSTVQQSTGVANESVSAGKPELAKTGSDSAGALTGAWLLLVAGVGALVARLRRR